MNPTVKTLISLLILAGNSIFAQTSNSGNSPKRLLCKEWRLISFEEDDGKFDPSPDQIGDRMRFELDHKVEYIEISKYKRGFWKYDAKGKVLTILNTQTREEKIMKVIKMTNNELILEGEDSEGTHLKMYMAAVTRRKKK